MATNLQQTAADALFNNDHFGEVFSQEDQDIDEFELLTPDVFQAILKELISSNEKKTEWLEHMGKLDDKNYYKEFMMFPTHFEA